jgi:carbohydrate binding protein with CBM4/9 domain/uncharacterized protein DUF3604
MNIRGWLVFIFVLTQLSASLVVGQPAKKPNNHKVRQCFDNGGFEKGLSGWRTKGIRLVEDPTVAHGGTRCLLGEVWQRKKGSEIKRTLKLRSDRMYRLKLWAKADNNSRLTIWLFDGEKYRIIANWQPVAERWRKYQVNFSVESDGPKTIKIVAPSSFWAPIGRMWIDDAALYELPLWEKVKLSKEGFNDFPVIAESTPNQAWVSWISFRDGHDTLQLARIRQSGNGVVLDQNWEIAGGHSKQILNPTLASNHLGAWLIFSSENDNNWDLYAVKLDKKDGPQKSIRLTKNAGVDIHPTACLRENTLWIAWESNRDAGHRQIYLTALRDGVVGKPQRLSSVGYNNYQPSIAVNKSGDLLVAWHSFRDNNYDLYARRVSSNSIANEQRLTFAPCIDRGVRLLAQGDGFWMAWEQASYAGYKIGEATTKRIHVAKYANNRLMVPKGLKKTKLWSKAESPDLKLDSKGRLWVAARVPRDRNSGWDVILWSYSNMGWSNPKVLSKHKGMNRSPGIAVFSRYITVCYQGDDIPNQFMSIEKSDQGKSDVYLSLIKHSTKERPKKLALRPYEPPKDMFWAATGRELRGEDRIGWEVTNAGNKLRLVFGDLHEHSDISVCHRTQDETPNQAYQMMRDIARYDFGALTDHGKNFNKYLWQYMGKMARTNTDPERFISFLGQEWSSTIEKSSRKYPFGYYGHRNLILADPYFTKWFNPVSGTTPAELWKSLQQTETNFVMIPHQLADTGNVPIDWDFNDETAEPVAEIYQMRGSYECKGCSLEARSATPRRGHFLQDAWARGVVIGVIAAPDHNGGLGKAGVYVEEFSREAILNAIRSRRTYGTTGAKIFLDVRVNGLFMGAVGKRAEGKPVRVEIRVDTPTPIRKVEIIRNNESIFQGLTKRKTMNLTYIDTSPLSGSAFYYVRVTLRNKEMAWSSPVWLGRLPKP